jgi:hypothetical protein
MMEEEDGDDEEWIQQGYQNYHKRSKASKLDVEHYRISWRLF